MTIGVALSLKHTIDRLQSPFRPAPSAMASLISGLRRFDEAAALATQAAGLAHGCMLPGVNLKMLSVAAQSITERDVPCPLAALGT